MKPHHLAHQFRLAHRFRRGCMRGRCQKSRDEGGEMPRVMHDIRVRQEHERRRARGHALTHGPHLSGPARRLRPALEDGEILGGAGALGRPIRGIVVDEEDVETAGVILGHEGCDDGLDRGRLVARRDHQVDRGAGNGRRRRKLRAGQPVSAMEKEQVRPHRQTEKAKNRHGGSGCRAALTSSTRRADCGSPRPARRHADHHR